MVTVAEFKAMLTASSANEIIEEVFFDGKAAHVSDEDIAYIQAALAAAYSIDAESVTIVITGSARLGFSITEKKKPGSAKLPRYRLFSAQSDIDVAVISPRIFDKIWLELSSHYHRSTWFPQDTGRLGDYLVTGWLRPDHFPKNVRLPFCDNWSDTFRKITRNTRFDRRRVNGGAFQSKEHLVQYLGRAVRACQAIEVTP